MAARLCRSIQRLTAWRCPQQNAFKNILRTHSGSSILSEHLKNVNRQLSITVAQQHRAFQRIPQSQSTKCKAHSRSSYSSGSTNSPTSTGGEDAPNTSKSEGGERHPDAEKEPLPEWPDGVNPNTGERGGPRGPEPTRYGDWERKGRVSDF